MAVSNFSSDTSARSSGYGPMVSRWSSSTHEPQSEDERRLSQGGMAEEDDDDDAELYERDNWPLNAPAARDGTPDTVISNLPGIQEESVDEHAITKRSGGAGKERDTSLVEKDVSDVDESEEDIREGNAEWDRKSWQQNGVDDTERAPRSIERTASPTQTGSVSPVDSDRPQGSGRPRPDSETDISPVRTSQSPESARASHEAPQVNGGSERSLHAPQEPMAQQPQIDELYEDEDERRDVATPIPPRNSSNAHDQLPPNHISPIANGRVTPNTNTNRSSIIKATPPQRTASRRSASITTHTPFNKERRERVRYSWQSVDDEEPNRPRIHIIKLVSNTATASAGFPQAEAFGFSISARGRRIAAYNSARLYILQCAALPVGISQDYALKRRPLAVEIVDEGDVLAILADEHTVNIYDLSHQRLQRIKTVKTDFPTYCIALSPTGALLANGYEGGVEIFSLDENALPTDRRAVRSQKMDRLMFSEDGSTLIGTTTRINVSSTVVVSVPVFPSSPSGIPTHEELKEAWCAELLHPENIRNSSHAVFMRENRQTCNEKLFAWNGLADTFGLLNIADMQYGNIDFPVVISPPLSTCGGLGAAIHSCPAIDEHGDTVAMVVNDRTIRLYIVPHLANDDETTFEAHSIDHELDEGYGCPFSDVQWVHSSASLPAPLNNQTAVQGRLVVASPGGVVDSAMNEETMEDLEGGRIILFDFDPQFAGQEGLTFSLTLGQQSPPQLLEEPELDVAHEVALVRRRTVNQHKSNTLNQRPATLGRAATTFGNRAERTPRAGGPDLNVNTIGSRRSMVSIHGQQSEAARSLPDLLETSESVDSVDAMDAFDEPYAQNAPRSHMSLQRAATNAQRHRFQALEERNQEHVSVESSGNFLALPEYTEEPNAPLPSRFRAMAGLDGPSAPSIKKPAIITNSDGDRRSPASSTPSSAPPYVGDNFSAEQAFVSAMNAPSSSSARSLQSREGLPSPTSASNGGLANPAPGISPLSRSGTTTSISAVSRSDTLESTNPVPRSLQRIYGQATPSPGPSPSLSPPAAMGDWERVSPMNDPAQPRHYPFPTPSLTSPLPNVTRPRTTGTRPEDQGWDSGTTLIPTSQDASPPRSGQGTFSYRFSTSLLNPPGHSPPVRYDQSSPNRAPSAASTIRPGSSASRSGARSPGGRRVPPHIQSFRNAAAANTSPSLFPPTQAPDHVPHLEAQPNAGSAPHPVTAWHPPAPSIVSPTPSSLARAHSRKRSSISNKSAFASTSKAKDLGFFRRGTKKQPKRLFGPEFASVQQGAGRREDANESVTETKSIFTTLTKRESRCAIM